MNARSFGAAAAVLGLGLASACSGDPAGTQNDSTASTGTDGASVAAASGRGGAGSAGEKAGSGAEPPAIISDYGLYVIDVADGTVTTLVEGTALSSVVVSPEGSRMVYSGETRYADPEAAGVFAYSGLFVAGVDGSDPVLVTDEWVWRRMWFPDGSGVLYTVEQDGLFALSMHDYSSTKVSDQRPRKVVFSEGGNILHGNIDGLFVSALDGTAQRRLAKFADDEWYEWRINRGHERVGWTLGADAREALAPTHVAYRTREGLMLAGIDDPEDSRLLTDLPPRDPYVCTPSGSVRRCRRLTDLPPRDSYYLWSPDGTKLGYIADENLYVAAVDGPEPMLLAEGGVHSFEWSPDGTKLAYTAEDGPVGRPLYVLDADGGEPLQLSGQGFASRPGWSPDGSHVAYVVGNSSDSNRVRLFVSALDGSDWRLVAHVTAERDLPHWLSNYFNAPFFQWLGDGNLLYVADFDEGRDEGELAVFDLHTDTTATLTGTWRGRLKFSPDRGRFTYTASDGPYVADGINQTRIGTPEGFGGDWSPDGRWLTFNDTDGGHVLDAATGAKHHISDKHIDYRFWSPDGTKLAYATRHHADNYEAAKGVHLYDTATGHTQKLATVTQGFSVIVPRWIPDGSAVTVTVTFIDYE